MKEKKTGHRVLLLISILFTIAALATIIPQASASEECMLGYKANCTFTPISTVLCIVGAAATCIIRKRLFM